MRRITLIACLAAGVLVASSASPNGEKAEKVAATTSRGPVINAFSNIERSGEGRREEGQPNPQARRRRLTYIAGDSRAPAWSPDGKWVAFENNQFGNWDIYVIRADGSDPRRLTDHQAADRYPAWSPSGVEIVFASDRPGHPDLYAVTVDTGEQRRITNSAAAESFPSWSPEGTWIAFTAPGDRGVLTIFRVSALGGAAEPLLPDRDHAVYPRWSPDGKLIAFFSRRDTNGSDDEIYVRVGPATLRRITSRRGHDFCPAWAPDGRRVAVVSLDEPGRSIRVIDLAGDTRAVLAGDMDRVTEPTWSPTGEYIAYAAAADKSLAIFIERVTP